MVAAIRQAVILAGGIGARLRPLTLDTPKPMVLVNNKPFLEYLIGLLKENGIKEVVLLLGYLPDKVKTYFGDGSKFGVGIKYSIGDVSFETGTRIKNAESMLDDYFLLMYSDNYWPLNLNNLAEFHNKRGALATVTIYANKDSSTKNNICVDEHGYVTKYDNTRQEKGLNGVDIGFFIINKKIMDMAPKHNFSFEQEILPKLIEKKQLCGFRTQHKYYSISTIEKLKITEEFLKPKKIIFLDRDGVINKRPGKADYVKSWKEFEFLPGAIDAISLLSKNGYEIYIITNQAGIARKAMTEDDLHIIHGNMEKELEKHDARINGIYYCPHGWDSNCECRKPKPGLFFKASYEHKFDLTKAIFIGDDERDLQAGNVAGCKTILVDGKNDLLKIVKTLIN